MTGNTDLENLPSKELHDRAIKLAMRHADLKFLWQLLTRIPAAEETAGKTGEGEADVRWIVPLIDDYIHSGDGSLADSLRPFYLEYLRRHG